MDASLTQNLFWTSLRVGSLVSLGAISIATVIQVSAGFIEYTGRRHAFADDRPKRFMYGITIALIIPAFVLHPALLAAFFFTSDYYFSSLQPVLSSLTHTQLGFYCLATYLYLPFAFFYMRGVSVGRFVSNFFSARNLGIDLYSALFVTLIGPLLAHLIPLFLYLTVMSEGMVLVPYFFPGGGVDTVGHAILSSTLNYSYSKFTARELISFTIVKVALVIAIGIGIRKCRYAIVDTFFTIMLIATRHTSLHERTVNNRSTVLMFLAPVFLILVTVPVLIPAAIVFSILITYAFSNFYQVIRHLPTLLTESRTNISLGDAFAQSCFVSMIAAISTTGLFLVLSIFLARRDGWEVGDSTYAFNRAAFFFSLFPFVISV